MNVPEELKYTAEHEWVRIEANLVTIGITDFAQDQLGDIVLVEIPEVGEDVTRGAVFGTVESVKSVSDLFAPVTGKVVEVNAALTDTPELVNDAPYGDGWMLRLEVADASAVEGLLDAAAYKDLVEKEEAG